MASDTNLSEWKRSWLSLGLVIHFFILSVCLINNNGASLLVRRIYQLMSPYAIAMQQDYGARQLEMTTGLSRSRPHLLQFHKRQSDAQQWLTVQPDSLPIINQFNARWGNFQHMLAVAAAEENEELIFIIFDQAARRALAAGEDVDLVRLVRPATLSLQQDRQYRQGKLPADALLDTVLFEARIVLMPDNKIKLLPVLERTRRSVSMESTP